MYKIKPLEWVYENTTEKYTDVEKQWSAYTEFAYFRIDKYRNDDELLTSCSFCRDWWYETFTDLEEAKKYCENVWRDKLKKCLIMEKSNA